MSGRPGLPPKVTTPGGRGLKFYSSLRLEFDVTVGVKDKIDDAFSTEEVNSLVGNTVQVKCIKNKVGVPGRTVKLRNRFGHGFDNNWSVLQVLVANNTIRQAGSWFTFAGEVSFSGEKLQIQGENNVLAALDRDPDWATRLGDMAQSALDKLVETP